MNLENKIEDIINEKSSLFRRSINFVKDKTLPILLSAAIGITSTYAFIGCDKKKKNVIPPVATIVTGPVQTDTNGQADIKDASGDDFYITVKDEKTLEPLENMQIYTIEHSTDIIVKDLLEQYISEIRITEPGAIEILLSKLNDRIAENLSQYKIWFYPEPIEWFKSNPELIGEDIPLSQLADFYETHETNTVNIYLQLMPSYWAVATFAQAAWKIRDQVIDVSDDIAKILGINPDLVLYDIYKEKSMGVLYHVRVDTNPIGNIKPIVLIETLRGELAGNIPINYTLGDANADTCSIMVEYSTDSGLTFTSTTEGPGSDGIINLNSSIGGINHTFVWDSLSDNIGISTSQNVQIKITPWDSEEGLEGIIGSFSVDNVPPTNISNNVGESSWPKIAVDSNNNSHIVWVDDTSGNWEIYYSKFNGSNWSVPIIISDTNHINWSGQDIIIDSLDNLHVIWSQCIPPYSGSDWEIYYSKFNGTWSTPENISNTSPTKPSYNPNIAVDSNNNLHVVWNSSNAPTAEGIYYSKFNGSDWSSSIDITNNDIENKYIPYISVDSLNNLHVVWEDNRLGDREIFYSKYDGNWSIPENISNTINDSWAPKISVDSNNYLHLVWYEDKGSIEEIYYNKYNGSWSTSQSIYNESGSSYSPKISVDSNNYLHLVWGDKGSGNSEILHSIYNGSWSTPTNISNTSGGSYCHSVTRDSNDELHVVWQENTSGNYEIFYKKK